MPKQTLVFVKGYIKRYSGTKPKISETYRLNRLPAPGMQFQDLFSSLLFLITHLSFPDFLRIILPYPAGERKIKKLIFD